MERRLGAVRIAVVNQKGGVGKTTTALNLADALVEGLAEGGGDGSDSREDPGRVLLIDLDSQAALTKGLGLEIDELEGSIYDVMVGKASVREVVIPAEEMPFEGTRVDFVPAEQALNDLEVILAGKPLGFHRVLREALDEVAGEYTAIVIDCRPHLERLEINAMCAADCLLIPVLAEAMPLDGTAQLLDVYEAVRDEFNPDLRLLGVLLTRVDNRNRLTRDVRETVRETFGDLTFGTEIGVSVRLAEVHRQAPSVLAYAPRSSGAYDYRDLAREVLERV